MTCPASSARHTPTWLSATGSPLTEDEWSALLAKQWFPFIGLSPDLVEQMLNTLRAGWDLDELVPRVVEHVRAELPAIKAFIQSDALFSRHRDVLSQALDAYEQGQHALVVSAIYPRIEGMIRDRIALSGGTDWKREALAETVVARDRQPYSPLLPSRFQAYLAEVFLPWESFTDPSNVLRVTRHAVAHGVANQAMLDEKAATFAILIIHQLAYLLS